MVLDYARALQAVARFGTAAEKLRSPGWARRQGGGIDINANLLEAEFDWLHKAFVDIETAKTIAWIKASHHNIHDRLVQEARDHNPQLVAEIGRASCRERECQYV